MKYMIMTFGDEGAWDTLGLGSSASTWSEDEVAQHFEAMAAFYADLAASGEMVTGYGLADPSHTVTVEFRDGRPMASDGPYTEAKEVLAGFGVIDVASYDRAVELAGRFASLVQTRVELRPVMDQSAPDV